MTHSLELGLDTFGDVTVDNDGQPLPHDQVIRNVVEEAVLADELGVDFIGIGEHHRADFAVSSPETVLAAIAGQTTRIRLGSAVTVLSSDDPVRVFQRFSTLDAVSNGRAEVILGRGSFTESFPLFGYELDQYQVLFEEKLDLFTRLLREQPVTWSGRTRSGLADQSAYPSLTTRGLRAWVGVGGSPDSVVRAAQYRLPLMIAIIGGQSARFAPFVDLYHETLQQFGAAPLPVGVHSPGHIADTEDLAREQLWPHWEKMRNRIGGERGWGPTTKREFHLAARPEGALYVGTPESVARKIATTVRTLGLSRFDMKYSAGELPHDLMMRSIELYGTKVIPMVHELLAEHPT